MRGADARLLRESFDGAVVRRAARSRMMEGAAQEVLALAGAVSEFYLLTRASLARGRVSQPQGTPLSHLLDELSIDNSRLLRVAGSLSPECPAAEFGVRTVGGLPMPILPVGGLLDDGESALVLDADCACYLVSWAMLQSVRVAPRHAETLACCIVSA